MMNRPKSARIVSVSACVAVLVLAVIVAGIVSAYLSEYGTTRFVFAAVILGLGGLVAAMLYAATLRHCTSRRRAVICACVLGLVIAAPPASMAFPGRMTYWRFGFSVYGLVPVPVLDITIGPNGGLWFRDKSHFVSLDEVQRLLTPDVEVLLIGVGWDSAARVDPAIEELRGPEVRVLPTPSAFESFNRCVSERRKVVLIAHSTC